MLNEHRHAFLHNDVRSHSLCVCKIGKPGCDKIARESHVVTPIEI